MKGTDKKIKGTGGAERVLYTTHAAAYDAKNRYNLPAEIEAPDAQAAFAAISHIFTMAPLPEVKPVTPPPEEKAPPVVEKKAEEKPATPPAEKKVEKAAAPLPVMATVAQLESIKVLADTKERRIIVECVMGEVNAVDLGELTAEQAARLIALLMTPTAGAKVPAKFADWLDGNRNAVQAYLEKVKWISSAQTWRELSQEKLDSIVERAKNFGKLAGLPAYE